MRATIPFLSWQEKIERMMEQQLRMDVTENEWCDKTSANVHIKRGFVRKTASGELIVSPSVQVE